MERRRLRALRATHADARRASGRKSGSICPAEPVPRWIVGTLGLPSDVAAGMTRREVMQKIGVRAAVALPLVTTLLVAAPKAHASGRAAARPHKKKW